MDTFLLAWNPKKWEWPAQDLANQILQVEDTGYADDGWSCGNTRNLPVGSRFFMIRLGVEPRGIVGSGRTTSDPAMRSHWSKQRGHEGKKAWYVGIRFDALASQPLITWAELAKPPFSTFRWGIQASGVRLPPEIADAVEKVWTRRASLDHPVLAEEFPPDCDIPEGARKSIVVNAYERNPKARKACLAHFGYQCAACGVRLAEHYGPIAAQLIHVHHITPLSSLSRSYRVNPTKDLRPVCPNCHAVIHRKDPPYSIKEVQGLLRSKKR